MKSLGVKGWLGDYLYNLKACNLCMKMTDTIFCWCMIPLCFIHTISIHSFWEFSAETFCRETLQEFLWSMRTEEGSFCMHEGGEVDIRGVYCAVSVARLTNICTEGLFAGTPHWIMRWGGLSRCILETTLVCLLSCLKKASHLSVKWLYQPKCCMQLLFPLLTVPHLV